MTPNDLRKEILDQALDISIFNGPEAQSRELALLALMGVARLTDLIESQSNQDQLTLLHEARACILDSGVNTWNSDIGRRAKDLVDRISNELSK